MKYDGLWERARPLLVSGDLSLDRIPVDGEPRWGLSLVALPSHAVRERLAVEVDALSRTLRGLHHVYDSADLHMTITSLEPYRNRTNSTLIARYADFIRDQQNSMDFRVELLGLGGSAAGVFVQGFDDGTLHPLRMAMREAATDLHGGEAPAPSFVRDTAHLSLNVHRQRIPEPEEVAFVDARRSVSYGAMTGELIALVDYRPADERMRLRILEIIH